jgi:hypothetical protein
MRLTPEEREALMDACPVATCASGGDHDDLFATVERIVSERERAAEVRALREAIREHAETFGVAGSTSRGWLRERADRIERDEP